MTKILKIKLTEANAELVEMTKSLTREKTATKAVLKALRLQVDLAEREGALETAKVEHRNRTALHRDQIRTSAHRLAQLADRMECDLSVSESETYRNEWLEEFAAAEMVRYPKMDKFDALQRARRRWRLDREDAEDAENRGT